MSLEPPGVHAGSSHAPLRAIALACALVAGGSTSACHLALRYVSGGNESDPEDGGADGGVSDGLSADLVGLPTGDASAAPDSGLGDGGLGDGGLGDSGTRDRPSWRLRTNLTASPPPLHGAKLAFASGLKEQPDALYLYGGLDQRGAYSAALWRYSADGWALVCDPCQPGPRHGHGWVYDETVGQLMLIGGSDGTRLCDEIWRFDGQRWLLSPSRLPQGRRGEIYAARMTHLARTVVFGGLDEQGEAQDDLYECEASTSTEDVECHGPMRPLPRPSPRADPGSSACYVPPGAEPGAAGTFVLVGGLSDGSADLGQGRDDAWAWNGEAWTRLCSSCIGEDFASAAVAYHPRLRRVLVVGGWSSRRYLELDGTRRIEPGGASLVIEIAGEPRPRDTSAIAYDPKLGRLVLYGGNGPRCSMQRDGVDAWAFNCEETLELVLVP